MSEPIVMLDGRVTLFVGDCFEVLDRIPMHSIDAVCCDPPYALESIRKRFGANGAAPAKAMKSGDKNFTRLSRGFMGKAWDTGDVAFNVDFWRKIYRTLLPGAHLVAFSGCRTYHRMATAIEDAGFDIREQVEFAHDHQTEILSFLDSLTEEQSAQFVKLFLEVGHGQLAWVFGSGFPKSHNVEKALAKSGHKEASFRARGTGTALKPSFEPICIARKPLSEKTIARNVMAHGTGAFNIDECRVGTEGGTNGCSNGNDSGSTNGFFSNGLNGSFGKTVSGLGRWPANVITDGSDEVIATFPDSGSGSGPREIFSKAHTSVANGANNDRMTLSIGDSGSAGRFFYNAKANEIDRMAANHPTVKPIELMRWLVRLVTPKLGTVLDPFAGTGTTGHAAFIEGRNAILIEREPEYVRDIIRRMSLIMAGNAEKKREIIKAKGKAEYNPGPLFAFGAAE